MTFLSLLGLSFGLEGPEGGGGGAWEGVVCRWHQGAAVGGRRGTPPASAPGGCPTERALSPLSRPSRTVTVNDGLWNEHGYISPAISRSPRGVGRRLQALTQPQWERGGGVPWVDWAGVPVPHSAVPWRPPRGELGASGVCGGALGTTAMYAPFAHRACYSHSEPRGSVPATPFPNAAERGHQKQIPERGLIHVYQIINLQIPQQEILYNFLKMSEQIMYGSQKLVIV